VYVKELAGVDAGYTCGIAGRDNPCLSMKLAINQQPAPRDNDTLVNKLRILVDIKLPGTTDVMWTKLIKGNLPEDLVTMPDFRAFSISAPLWIVLNP
jgi:hypothetical protein